MILASEHYIFLHSSKTNKRANITFLFSLDSRMHLKTDAQDYIVYCLDVYTLLFLVFHLYVHIRQNKQILRKEDVEENESSQENYYYLTQYIIFYFQRRNSYCNWLDSIIFSSHHNSSISTKQNSFLYSLTSTRKRRCRCIHIHPFMYSFFLYLPCHFIHIYVVHMHTDWLRNSSKTADIQKWDKVFTSQQDPLLHVIWIWMTVSWASKINAMRYLSFLKISTCSLSLKPRIFSEGLIFHSLSSFVCCLLLFFCLIISLN